jgi:simple sugar transport system substrate-binding protein
VDALTGLDPRLRGDDPFDKPSPMTLPTTLLGLLAAALLLAAAGCGSGSDRAHGDGSADAGRDDVRIVVVTHGQASDPFWSVVQNGAAQAGRDLGVEVEYQAPQTFDMVAMGQLIDAAVASRPSGLVVSIPDADALSGRIRAAVEAGIPVVSINSGDDVAAGLGVLTHVGQAERAAGYGGGQRLAEAGARHALCVNQEVGNVGLDLRCEGFAAAIEEAGGTATVLGVEAVDPTEAQQRIQAALAADPAIDGMLMLGTPAVVPALRAVEEAAPGRVRLATFDVSPDVLDAIEGGTMLFAIDQQQYLQGYLPVVLLTLYHRNANTFPEAVLPTGPGFVTRENVGRLRELTQQGTR